MKLSHDSLFWRKLARFGAAYGPEWWVHYSPPVFGWAAAALLAKERRVVLDNLRRIRGPRSKVEDAVDVARTFSAYAGCLAEVLSNGSKNERMPDATLDGGHNMDEALGHGRGIVLVTMHTAGWETVGPLLSRERPVDILMVMAREPNAAARELQDEARMASGLGVAHVDNDPLASLKLLQHLRKARGVVGIQLDRAPPGIRTRPVTLFGKSAQLPEGPLRLAAISGAPILPLFCARTGYRRYMIDARPPFMMRRRPSDSELDAAAQRLADEMTRFLSAHPTQWFNFRHT